MVFDDYKDYGKKVFFLNVPYDFKKIIIPSLSEKEYEVYIIDDYKKAKAVLRQNPDSVCFIYIDTGPTFDEWFNFICSFEQDKSLASVFLGIMSDRANKADKDHFLLNTFIPAGFISIAGGQEKVLETVDTILQINGVKGQRKYLRADCEKDRHTNASCEVSGLNHLLGIKNISIIGASCFALDAESKIFEPNTLVREFKMNLNNKPVKTSAVIVHSSVANGVVTSVFLFTKNMPFTSKIAVREYIRNFLQSKIDLIIAQTPPDETDYTVRIRRQQESHDAFLIAVEDYDY